MLGLSEQTRVFLRPGITDGRLGVYGLRGLVSQGLGLDMLTGDLFVFCNKRRHRISCLRWDGSGLWLASKRLEQGTYAWPHDEASVTQMSLAQLRLLLDGFELKSRRGWQRYEARLPAGLPLRSGQRAPSCVPRSCWARYCVWKA